MSDDEEAAARQDVLDDIEVTRTRSALEVGMRAEDKQSVMDWSDRIRNATRHAFSMARAGAVTEEYLAWIDVASIAAGRAEQIRRQQLREG